MILLFASIISQQKFFKIMPSLHHLLYIWLIMCEICVKAIFRDKDKHTEKTHLLSNHPAEFSKARAGRKVMRYKVVVHYCLTLRLASIACFTAVKRLFDNCGANVRQLWNKRTATDEQTRSAGL